jgi:uncharacterized protein YukE
MSMDDQYREMKRFLQDLIEFNERLRASIHDLEDCYSRVSPHWQDAMRRTFDSRWTPFRTNMKHYAASEGPGFAEFLNIKLHALGRYLGEDSI